MFRRLALMLVVMTLAIGNVRAEDQEPLADDEQVEAAPPAASPPPLPCITIEGNGGIFITPMAYLVNPSMGDKWLGLPSLAFSYASIGDKDFTSVGGTMTLFKRVELGFAHERFGLGSWTKDVFMATGLDPGVQTIRMDTFSVRAQIVEEKGWIPAITLGGHYKRNRDVWRLDRRLRGACRMVGVKDDDGWEATLIASKTFTGILPRPFILSLGVRNTDAAQTGLLGFTGHRDTVFEANAIFFLTDRLLIAGEYRQKPDNLRRIPGLIEEEDDWWTICLGYVVNDRATLAVGYGHFGKILNHDENGVWAVQVKFEF